MQIFGQTNFDFLGKKTPFFILSAVLTLIGVGSLVMKGGPQYGIDFKGGNLLFVKFAEKPSEEAIRTALTRKIGGEVSVVAVQGTNELQIQTEIKAERELQTTRQQIEATLNELFSAQPGKLDFNSAGSEALFERLNLPLQRGGVFISDEDLRKLITEILKVRDTEKGGILTNFADLSKVAGMKPEILKVIEQEAFNGKYSIRSADVVGPKVGNELRTQALLATLYALGGMLIYIGLRFEFAYGFAAVLAVLHDTIITIGLFSVFDKEISLTVVAALLTLVGYSMNDTIVVFDRIRENLQRGRKGDMKDIVNRSINETLSRTVMTSGLTLLTAMALLLFGGQILNGFAFALVVGIVIGTYSSIFIASPILVWWQDRAKQKGSAAGRTPGSSAAASTPNKVAAK